MQTAGSAVTVAGAGLLMRAASALVRAVGQWLTEQATARETFVVPDYFMDGLLIDGYQVTGIY